MASNTESEVESTLQTTSPSLGGTTLVPSDSSSAPSSSLETTRRDLEKWQLLHTIQILKLELSQKDAILDSMKSEHMQKRDELEEELSETQCDRNLLQQRLKALSKVYEVCIIILSCIIIIMYVIYASFVPRPFVWVGYETMGQKFLRVL